jgi:hypothetical protein
MGFSILFFLEIHRPSKAVNSHIIKKQGFNNNRQI